MKNPRIEYWTARDEGMGGEEAGEVKDLGFLGWEGEREEKEEKEEVAGKVGLGREKERKKLPR